MHCLLLCIFSEAENLFRVIYEAVLRVRSFMILKSLRCNKFKSAPMRERHYILFKSVLATILHVDSEHPSWNQILMDVLYRRN